MKKRWNRDFILMLQGNAVSALGDLLYSVAIGYWVYEQTGSSTLMGIMSSISMFVTMFLSPFAGSIVDKWSRKQVIVGMDLLRGILMLAVGILAYREALSVAAILAAAFLSSLCSVLFSPAVGTLMIDLIPHDDMVRGQSIHSGIQSLVSLVGKAISGVLVAFWGVPLIVVLNGISYLFSAFTELFIRVPPTVQQGEPVTVAGLLRDFSNAIRSIFSNRFLRLFVPSALILNLLGAGPMSLMLPFCTEKGFSVDMYGIIMLLESAAYGLGVMVLGIIKLTPKIRYRVLSIGFISATILTIPTYLATNFYILGILLFLGSLLNAAANTIFNATLMLALPEENRGAILGFINAASTGGCALSAVIFGILGDFFPLYLVFVAGSILCLIPMLYLCLHQYSREFILTH